MASIGVLLIASTCIFSFSLLFILKTSTTGQIHIMATLRSVVSRETWRGLFAGNGANCIRVLPFSALVCLAYSNLSSVSSCSLSLSLPPHSVVFLLLILSSPLLSISPLTGVKVHGGSQYGGWEQEQQRVSLLLCLLTPWMWSGQDSLYSNPQKQPPTEVNDQLSVYLIHHTIIIPNIKSSCTYIYMGLPTNINACISGADLEFEEGGGGGGTKRHA